MTKKDFKTQCDFHEYRGGGLKINAIFLRGKRYFSHMVRADVTDYTKAELFNILYDWVTEKIQEPPTDVHYKIALDEEHEFKVPLSL